MEKKENDVVHRRRSYDDEFKRGAVRLVSEEGFTFKAAAAAVNVSEQSLRVWCAKLAPAAPPCGEDATLEQLKAETARLFDGDHRQTIPTLWRELTRRCAFLA